MTDGIGAFLQLIVWVAIVLLLARLILDWVQVLARHWRPEGAVAVLCEGIYSATDPPMRAVRRAIPPIRLGNTMIDLSLMVLLFGLYILMSIIAAVFA